MEEKSEIVRMVKKKMTLFLTVCLIVELLVFLNVIVTPSGKGTLFIGGFFIFIPMVLVYLLVRSFFKRRLCSKDIYIIFIMAFAFNGFIAFLQDRKTLEIMRDVKEESIKANEGAIF